MFSTGNAPQSASCTTLFIGFEYHCYSFYVIALDPPHSGAARDLSAAGSRHMPISETRPRGPCRESSSPSARPTTPIRSAAPTPTPPCSRRSPATSVARVRCVSTTELERTAPPGLSRSTPRAGQAAINGPCWRASRRPKGSGLLMSRRRRAAPQVPGRDRHPDLRRLRALIPRPPQKAARGAGHARLYSRRPRGVRHDRNTSVRARDRFAEERTGPGSPTAPTALVPAANQAGPRGVSCRCGAAPASAQRLWAIAASSSPEHHTATSSRRGLRPKRRRTYKGCRRRHLPVGHQGPLSFFQTDLRSIRDARASRPRVRSPEPPACRCTMTACCVRTPHRASLAFGPRRPWPAGSPSWSSSSSGCASHGLHHHLSFQTDWGEEFGGKSPKKLAGLDRRIFRPSPPRCSAFARAHDGQRDRRAQPSLGRRGALQPSAHPLPQHRRLPPRQLPLAVPLEPAPGHFGKHMYGRRPFDRAREILPTLRRDVALFPPSCSITSAPYPAPGPALPLISDPEGVTMSRLITRVTWRGPCRRVQYRDARGRGAGPPVGRRPRRRLRPAFVLNVVFLGGGAALLAVLVLKLDTAQVAARLRQVGWAGLGMLGCYVAGLVVTTAAWQSTIDPAARGPAPHLSRRSGGHA